MTSYSQEDQTVHLWLLSIPETLDKEKRGLLLAHLGPEERRRFAEMTGEGRQKEYLLSHALARVKIAGVLGLPPVEVPLVFEEGKSPRLLSPPLCKGRPGGVECSAGSLPPPTPPYKGGEVHLSLSHTRSLIACALAPFPVGVDVEQIGRVAHIDDVARRMFHPAEADEVGSLEGDEKKLRFTQYWALREAFYKASGWSLKEACEGVVFRIGEEDRRWKTEDGKHCFLPSFSILHPPSSILHLPSPWSFSLTRPRPGHILALAANSPEKIILQAITVMLDELIR